MKFTSLFFVATAAATAYAQDASLVQDNDNDSRGLSSLANKWNITDPAFGYGSLGFTLQYGINQYIYDNEEYGMVKWSIWDDNCKPSDGSAGNQIWNQTISPAGPGLMPGFTSVNGTAGDDLPDQYPTIVESPTADGTYTIGVQIDPETITSNTDLYREFTNEDDGLSAEVRFCNRFELWTPAKIFTPTPGTTTGTITDNPTPLEVNFLETLVTLTVDLTDGFEIGSITVEPKDRVVRTANQVYLVVGFLCGSGDDGLDRLTGIERTRPRNQGEVVKVCVEPEQVAQDDGIFMRSIDSFTFTRDSFSQAAIVGGAAAGNLLTTYDPSLCQGYTTCWFETILFANFYTSAGGVDGSGIASMQFGQEKLAGRRLRSGDSRQLQEEPAAAAEFELEFGIAQTAESASGASSMGLMVASGAALSSIVAMLI